MKVFGFHMMIKAFVSQFNIEIKSSFFPSLLRLQRKMVGRGGAVRCGAALARLRSDAAGACVTRAVRCCAIGRHDRLRKERRKGWGVGRGGQADWASHVRLAW
jgi:hypothetical protein